ncbi:MAG: hypothetical protein GX488_11065 [Clostridiales bacterium]|nr:hypothetical protein [Clostridiales bacterium]
MVKNYLFWIPVALIPWCILFSVVIGKAWGDAYGIALLFVSLISISAYEIVEARKND